MRNREPFLGCPDGPARSIALGEWEIRLYTCYVGGMHKRCLAELAFALCAFGRQQMASRRVRAQHFAARRNLKTLGD